MQERILSKECECTIFRSTKRREHKILRLFVSKVFQIDEKNKEKMKKE